jgi:hypothetical protein
MTVAALVPDAPLGVGYKIYVTQPGSFGAEVLFPLDDQELLIALPPYLLIGEMTQGDTSKGGEGSGNFGHSGRPGEEGGSAPGDGGDNGATYGGARLSGIAPRSVAGPERILALGRYSKFIATRSSYGGDSIQRREAALAIAQRNSRSVTQVERALRTWTSAPPSSSLALIAYESAAARAFSLSLDRKTGDQYYRWLGVRANAIAKGDISLARAIAHPYEYPPADANLKKFLAELPKELNPDDQKALVAQLQAQYEYTQSLLKDADVEGIEAYAAVTMSKPHERNETISFNARHVLFTWTSDLRHALTEAAAENRYVIRSFIPRDRILAVPQTGMGAARRSDVIMIAGHTSAGTAKVYSVPPRQRS